MVHPYNETPLTIKNNKYFKSIFIKTSHWKNKETNVLINHKQKCKRTLEYQASDVIKSKEYWKEEKLALAQYAATWE